jgi:hypothetical protein
MMTSLFCFYFNHGEALAQVYNSSVSTATGGSGRASVEPGDALLLNASTLPHLRGRFLYTSLDEHGFVVSLSDNTTESTLPAGVTYIQKSSEVFLSGILKELKYKDIAISLADFIVTNWTVGITGHYLEHQLKESSYIHSNMDIGFLYTPQPKLGLGFVFYNILPPKETLPVELKEKMSLGLGVNYLYHEMIRTRFDVSTESIWAVGLETYLNRFVITRFGYSDNFDVERQIFTAGLGFNGPRFQFNYAYLGNIQKSSDYRHSVDMVIPF